MALGMLGAANWVAWWYRAGVDDDAERTADVLVEMLLGGVHRGNDRAVGAGPFAALAMLKEDLAHLEGALTSALGPEVADQAG